jgi:hypothetical protein
LSLATPIVADRPFAVFGGADDPLALLPPLPPQSVLSTGWCCSARIRRRTVR